MKKSAWSKGVAAYKIEFEDYLAENKQDGTKTNLLNGSKSWKEFSGGGCSLIYDHEIAERLCNPTELKRCKGGDKPPNAHESWLDVQARALNQAARQLIRAKTESIL